jgi:hypothetical protein
LEALGEESMTKWPTSGWTHAGIAFATAAILSALVEYLTEKSVLTRNFRLYGDKGWNSLGASLTGFAAAFWTLLITFILIFIIQRIFAANRE